MLPFVTLLVGKMLRFVTLFAREHNYNYQRKMLSFVNV